jgi:archaellum component FlaG (FlaF/FlaG flagellin family)
MLPRTLLFARAIVASTALAALAVLLVCRFSNLRAADSSSGQAAVTEIPVAHSALLTVGATQTDDSVALYVRRVHDHSIVSSDDVTVTVDGKNETVTHDRGGSYSVPASDLRGDGTRAVEVIVGHDGIREVLSGKVTFPEASSAGSVFRDHRQIGWWVLNIVIVLIAAIFLSRRKG